MKYLLGWEISPEAAFVFDVMVQVATLVAVFAYFWTDIVTITKITFQDLGQKHPTAHPESKLAWLLILATIPAAVFGFIFNGTLAKAFGSPMTTAIFLLVTAARIKRNLQRCNVPTSFLRSAMTSRLSIPVLTDANS